MTEVQTNLKNDSKEAKNDLKEVQTNLKNDLKVCAGASLMTLYIGALFDLMKLPMNVECILQSIKGYVI